LPTAKRLKRYQRGGHKGGLDMYTNPNQIIEATTAAQTLPGIDWGSFGVGVLAALFVIMILRAVYAMGQCDEAQDRLKNMK
jgi:hypothetical protein